MVANSCLLTPGQEAGDGDHYQSEVKGHVYYYLVEGKRVDGKSRLVKQQSLGRAEQVVARLEGQSPEPTRVRVAEFGGAKPCSPSPGGYGWSDSLMPSRPSATRGYPWAPISCWRS